MGGRLEDVQLPLNKIFTYDIARHVVPSAERGQRSWDFEMGALLRRPFGIAWLEGWVRSERPAEQNGVWWKLFLKDSKGVASFSANCENLSEISGIEGEEWKIYAGILIQTGTSLDPSTENALPYFECIRLSPMEAKNDRESNWTSQVLLYKKWMINNAHVWE